MAIYIGTKEEFKKHFGGYLKQVVNNITRASKNEIGNVCEYCKKINVLEAAHVKGYERSKIIDCILDEEFKDKNKGCYIVDTDKFDVLYKGVHKPVKKMFHFLCRDCHTKYDNGIISLEDEVFIDEKKEVKQVIEVPSFNIPEEYLRKGESVQEYVKKVFNNLYKNNILTEEILKELQDKEFCKKTFGLNFSLLEENNRKTIVSGHSRYYKNFKIGKYFLCSQWWKEKEFIYTKNIYSWIGKILNI